MISLPTLNGVLRALTVLGISIVIIAVIMLIGEIVYRLEERWKKK